MKNYFIVFCLSALLLGLEAEEFSNLPKQGNYPISVAEREGVEQVMVLNHRWIALVIDNVPEVRKQLDLLTEGKY